LNQTPSTGPKISVITTKKWKLTSLKNNPKDNSSDSLGRKMNNARNVTLLLLIGNNSMVMNTLVTQVDWSLPN
jgi:hypothetical protein